MVAFPHAKINLGLQVIEKRHDGFHNIISGLFPITWCDVLEVLPADTFSFTNTGLKIPGDPHKNLCVKAYRLLKELYPIPEIQIHLHKVIPMGAGLGGGSSDAVHMLKMLDSLFELDLSPSVLKEYAAQLGSDCPFFVENTAQLAQGRGEVLSPLDIKIPSGYLLVICPDIAVSTAEAYAGLSPRAARYDLPKLLQTSNLKQWKTELHNDFEETVFVKYPQIKEVKAQMYQMGAEYASMSGSGASVYGIFKLRPELHHIPSQYLCWLQEI